MTAKARPGLTLWLPRSTGQTAAWVLDLCGHLQTASGAPTATRSKPTGPRRNLTSQSTDPCDPLRKPNADLIVPGPARTAYERALLESIPRPDGILAGPGRPPTHKPTPPPETPGPPSAV